MHRALGTFLFAGGLALVLSVAAAAAADPYLCLADLDGDGSVGTGDLNIVLAAWGTPNPLADFDGDGDVGCFDQAFVLGHWGACPEVPEDVNGDGVVDLEDLDFARGNLSLECHSDLNLDGAIDQDDIDALLCLWGSAGPLGDFDGDGLVGTGDLSELLADFGLPCQCDLDRDGAVTASDIIILTKGIGK